MNGRVCRRAVATMTLALSIFLPAHGGEAPGLRFRPKIGQEQRYEFRSSTLITTSGPNQKPNEKRATVQMRMAVTARSIDDSGCVLDVALMSYAYTTELARSTAAYDSRKTPSDEFSKKLDQEFQELFGIPVTVKVDETGTVTEVSGVERLPDSRARRRLISVLFSVSGMEEKLGHAFGTRSEDPEPRAGLMWSTQDTLDVDRPEEDVRTTYLVKSVKDSVAHIQVTSEWGVSNPPARAGHGFNLGKSLVEGVQQWDTERGLLSRYDGTQTSRASEVRGDQTLEHDFRWTTSLVREPDPVPSSP